MMKNLDVATVLTLRDQVAYQPGQEKAELRHVGREQECREPSEKDHPHGGHKHLVYRGVADTAAEIKQRGRRRRDVHRAGAAPAA